MSEWYLSPWRTQKHHMMKVNLHQEKSAESGMENTAALMMITKGWGEAFLNA